MLVASNESNLGNNTGDMWDSGKVESDESMNVVYQGKSLKSAKLIWENSSYVEGVEGIREACEDKGYVTFRVEPGSYFFKVKNKKFHR